MAQAVKKRGAGGRPTKYKTEYCDRTFDFALVGMTDDEIAGALKIDRATLYRWKNAQPELCDAIKRGRGRFLCAGDSDAPGPVSCGPAAR